MLFNCVINIACRLWKRVIRTGAMWHSNYSTFLSCMILSMAHIYLFPLFLSVLSWVFTVLATESLSQSVKMLILSNTPCFCDISFSHQSSEKWKPVVQPEEDIIDIALGHKSFADSAYIITKLTIFLVKSQVMTTLDEVHLLNKY